jgi:nucleoside-diphosphate-sugar epimerase
MKISVTGASGFIGKILCDELMLQKHEISILTRKDVPPITGVNVVKGDLISDSANLQVFVDGVDVVCHCAGEIKDETLMERVHVGGTKRLLNAVHESIKRHGKPVHWVQLSSVGAYGVVGPGSRGSRIINEQSPEHPFGVYELTKTASDQLVCEFAQQEPLFSFTILRPTVVIGSNMPNQSFHAMARMIKRGLFFRIGRQQTIANYVHVHDVVRALIQCLFYVRARGQVFIISNDCPLDLVVDSLANAMNVPAPKWVVPEGPLRLLVKATSPWIKLPLTTARIDALTRQTHYSSNKINQTLCFSPLTSIPESIPKLVAESTERLA